MDFDKRNYIDYMNNIISILDTSNIEQSCPGLDTSDSSCISIPISATELINVLTKINRYTCDYKLNNVFDNKLNNVFDNKLISSYNTLGTYNKFYSANKQLDSVNKQYYFSLLQNYTLLFIIIITIICFGNFKGTVTKGTFATFISMLSKLFHNPIYIVILLIIILATIYIISLIINNKSFFY
jgi:hypothetical protein